MILLGIIFDFLPFWGEVVAFGIVALIFYACLCPSSKNDDDTFQIEDDLHAIRQCLERLEKRERPESSTPEGRKAEEAERKMESLR